MPSPVYLRMAQALAPVKFEKGEYIMLDGDPGDKMYFMEVWLPHAGFVLSER